MTPTTYNQWIAAGEPWHPARPIDELAKRLQDHGYTVYTIGDTAHLQADPPEDHTPYSRTPWPGPQPYGAVLALDVMPGGPVDWRELGARIVADKLAGVHGTEWIKYVNWTDRGSACWHDRWEPDHTHNPSTDAGHIHISGRTDYVDSDIVDASGWDPVAAILAGEPAPPPTNQGDPMLTSWTPVQKGSTGPAVKIVEGLLIAHGLPVGCDPLHLDGVFGPSCDASTRRLQELYGINVDGVFGAHTLSVAIYARDLA